MTGIQSSRNAMEAEHDAIERDTLMAEREIYGDDAATAAARATSKSTGKQDMRDIMSAGDIHFHQPSQQPAGSGSNKWMGPLLGVLAGILIAIAAYFISQVRLPDGSGEAPEGSGTVPELVILDDQE